MYRIYTVRYFSLFIFYYDLPEREREREREVAIIYMCLISPVHIGNREILRYNGPALPCHLKLPLKAEACNLYMDKICTYCKNLSTWTI